MQQVFKSGLGEAHQMPSIWVRSAVTDQRIFERIFETTWLTVVDTHLQRQLALGKEPRLVCASDCAAGAGLMLTRINPARAGQPPLSGPPPDTIT
jgi:hypothetical protein